MKLISWKAILNMININIMVKSVKKIIQIFSVFHHFFYELRSSFHPKSWFHGIMNGNVILLGQNY